MADKEKLCASLLKEIRVEESRNELNNSIRSAKSFSWGCCWLGRGSIYSNGVAHLHPIRLALLPFWLLVWIAVVPFHLTLHILVSGGKILSNTIGLMKTVQIEQPAYHSSKGSLWVLWQLHTNNAHLTSYGEVTLLTGWFRILYGEDGSNIDIDERIKIIGKRQARVNLKNFSSDGQTPHFFFIPAIESLIQELETELGPYA